MNKQDNCIELEASVAMHSLIAKLNTIKSVDLLYMCTTLPNPAIVAWTQGVALD